jgi:CheY-like chemotaxis protein
MANERIYLVTADSELGMRLYGAMERNGYAVETFASPSDAINAIEKEMLPDAVITDAFDGAMPAGLDVLRVTGEKDAVGFLLSAAPDENARKQAKAAGGRKASLLPRDADEDELLSALAHALLSEGAPM